ncbi:hypothetical protein AAIR98_000397 [Elusimicrobium simillimum]|uniref:hypothetical protein n=1 Tax=Elusimicrobium simillimum TaxID=3143438 RepID=UPI003C6FCBF5
MKKTLTALTCLVLVAAACQKASAPAPQGPTAEQCLGQSKFEKTMYKNDCLGITLKSSANFLFSQTMLANNPLFFSVPDFNYTLSIFVLNFETPDINSDGNKTLFEAEVEKFFAQNLPYFKKMKAQYTNFGNVPSYYIAGSESGIIEKYFFFKHNGVWAYLYMGAQEKEYNKANKDQAKLIKSIKFYTAEEAAQ